MLSSTHVLDETEQAFKMGEATQNNMIRLFWMRSNEILETWSGIKAKDVKHISQAAEDLHNLSNFICWIYESTHSVHLWIVSPLRWDRLSREDKQH